MSACGNTWMALLFIALFYFSPGFSTPLFNRQTDELHFSKQVIGNLGVFSSFFGILAAVGYSQLIKRVSIRTMLMIGIATSASGTLLYLFYSTWTRAMFIESRMGSFSLSQNSPFSTSRREIRLRGAKVLDTR